MTELKRQLIELKQSELQELKQLFSQGKNIEGWLVRNGWGELGSGYYSVVYDNPSSQYVIKVLMGDLPARSSEIYRCGVAWLRFCQKNYHTNPHFVKVFHVQTSQQSHDLKYYAVLEKLQPMPKKQLIELLSDTDTFVALYAMDNGRFLIELTDGSVYDYGRDIQDEYGKDIIEIFKDNVSQNHPLSVAVSSVMAFRNRKCPMDISITNLMSRNGTIVFTDPLHG